MTNKRMICWNNIEHCTEYFKSVGYEGESLNQRVKNSITYGNYFDMKRVEDINSKYDVRIVGGL